MKVVIIKLLEINSKVGVYYTDWYEIKYPKTDKDYATVIFESQMVDIVDCFGLYLFLLLM